MMGIATSSRLPGVVLLLGLLVPPPAVAIEPPARVTVRDAAERALASFPSVAAARARQESARLELGEERARLLPSLWLTGSATRYEEPMLVTPIHTFQPTELPKFDETLLRGGLRLEYTLFDGGGRGARIRQGRSRLDGAEAGLAAGEQALLGRVASTYVRVLGSQQLLEAHDGRLEALNLERDRVNQHLEAGRAAEVEVRRIEATLASAQADRVRSAAALDSAERELARLVGVDVAWVRADHLVPVGLRDASLFTRKSVETLAASPEIRGAETRVRAADDAVSIGKAARWPGIRVAGNYLAYGDSDETFDVEWTAALLFDLPLFTGGAITRRIERARAELDAARQELRLTRTQVDSAMDHALSAAEEARARVVSLERAAEQYREVARIEKLRLETGAATQVEYLSSEAELLAVQAKLVDARNVEVEARVEIARVMGKLDLAWLDQNVEVRP